MTIKSIIAASTLALTIAIAGAQTGCKDQNDCDAVIDHTLTLMPKEFADAAKADRKGMLKKCEEASPEARKCLLAAKNLEDLGACSKKHK